MEWALERDQTLLFRLCISYMTVNDIYMTVKEQ